MKRKTVRELANKLVSVANVNQLRKLFQELDRENGQ